MNPNLRRYMGRIVIIAALAVLIGFCGADSSYYSGNSHPTLLGLLAYLLAWGSLSATCLFLSLANFVLPSPDRRRTRGDDGSSVLQNDGGGSDNLFLDGHYDSRSGRGGSAELTGPEMGGQFGSADSPISESTIFNPATGIEMDGAFDKAGNLFGHGFGE